MYGTYLDISLLDTIEEEDAGGVKVMVLFVSDNLTIYNQLITFEFQHSYWTYAAACYIYIHEFKTKWGLGRRCRSYSEHDAFTYIHVYMLQSHTI